MDSYKTRLKDITTFIFDVDGVMTNGKIIYTHDGKIDRQFYAKDGYAIKYAISKGYRIAIISGGMQENVRKRLNSLGVEDVFLKAFNKIEVFNEFIKEKREKYNSLFLTNYRESNSIARKRISFDLAFKICNYMLTHDLS